jgi:hypothetical protein
MIRMFRLTNESGGLGLSCSPAGVALAGVPLLRSTQAGFVPRPTSEIASLLKAAYGEDPTGLQPRLGAIAQALNRGDFAFAAIAAVQTRTPELSREAAVRLVNAERWLIKYDPNEPRDRHGRWTTGEGAPAPVASPTSDDANSRGNEFTDTRASNPEEATGGPNSLLIPAAFTVPDQEENGADSPNPGSLEQEFEKKYDDLGPVDFAKRVIEFGDWLAREGGSLSPAERERVLAEYSFLQDRLSFWLSYEYKPAIAHANLLSAALALYQGAMIGGIVRVGDFPRSMLDVAGAAWAFDNVPPRRILPSARSGVENTPAERLEPPNEVQGLGGIVNNSEARIDWAKGIKEQGDDFETYYGKENPQARRLLPGATAFDYFDDGTGEAVSTKTLNTQTANRIRNPQKIFEKVKEYVDDMIDYEPLRQTDPDPDEIQSKTLYLAIPEYTSPTQWRYLNRVIIYAKDNGISIVITRIRD